MEVERFRLRLRDPLVTAWARFRAGDRARPDRRGVGEAAPLEPYDGVPMAAVMAALDAYARCSRTSPRTS